MSVELAALKKSEAGDHHVHEIGIVYILLFLLRGGEKEEKGKKTCFCAKRGKRRGREMVIMCNHRGRKTKQILA